MNDEIDEEMPFDWCLYGALVKNWRNRKGYKTAESFSETIWRRTRANVSRDSLYKIEKGKQVPDAVQFMAINMSLFGNPFPGKLVDACFSPEWMGIIKLGAIPRPWKIENTQIAEAEDPGLNSIDCVSGHPSLDEDRIPDDIKLFTYYDPSEELPF